MDDRLTLSSLYGGGRTKSNVIDKKKAYSPKSSISKKNSFSHYDPKEDNKDDKDESTDSDKWRKQNRILQAELNNIKKELEQMKRTNAELKRELELLQQ
jgi:predicted RNase H-like nuclease (RuvC/YqgF family)